MQKPLLFLATADQDLEDNTAELVLAIGGTLLRARSLHYACQILGLRRTEIALALVDVDLREGGRSLVHILARCQHDYPIVAVTENPETCEQDETIRDTIVAVLKKPALPGDLEILVERFLRQSSHHPEPASATTALLG